MTGSDVLLGGNKQIGEGIATLYTGLESGEKQLANNDLASKSSFISKPTYANKISINHVENYGNIFIAYLIPLGLYISAVAFNFIYPMAAPTDYTEVRNKKWYRSKMFVMLMQATLQAVITGFLMKRLLGVVPESSGQFYIMILIVSLAYISLVTFLTITMGNVGRFVAIVLLVVQLASAGGTFPIETSNNFFITLHNYLPLTYALQGLQHTIAGGLQAHYTGGLTYLSILFIVCLCAIRGYYYYHEKTRQINKRLIVKILV